MPEHVRGGWSQRPKSIMKPLRQTFPNADAFAVAWRSPEEARTEGPERVERIATLVAEPLAREGFRLFHNGGLPQLDRRHGELRAEILFPTRPHSNDFAVRFHLTHDGVGTVRARFWQPAVRAPKTVASGDVGLLEDEPVHALWSSEEPERVANAIGEALLERVIPWFDLIDDPPRLRDALLEGTVPMIDLTTSVEIMLAEFGVREARRYLRSVAELAWPPLAVPKPDGFELNEDRMAMVVSYYRL